MAAHACCWHSYIWKTYTSKTADLYRIANNKIVEHWDIVESVKMLHQLGAIKFNKPKKIIYEIMLYSKEEDLLLSSLLLLSSNAIFSYHIEFLS